VNFISNFKGSLIKYGERGERERERGRERERERERESEREREREREREKLIRRNTKPRKLPQAKAVRHDSRMAIFAATEWS
jgi:hypothetical protein